ncbi:MAG: hypothetical protein Q9169_002928 [Polycauliona sp. 2 TL-2023]
MQQFKHVKIPSLSSVYTQDGRLPNVGSDYSRIPRLPRHKWSDDEKQTLHILHTNYPNPSHELWVLFNSHFTERRRHWTPPRKSAWVTMSSFIAKKRYFRVWWSESAARRVRSELQRTALSNGIRLLSKDHNLNPSTPIRQQQRRKRFRSVSLDSATSIANEEEEDDDDDDDGIHSLQSAKPEPKSQVRRKLFDTSRPPVAKGAILANGLPTPPPIAKKASRWNSKIQAPIPIPSIVFRAFNSQSQGINRHTGFVAGKYINTPPSCIPRPPPEAEYLQELERHLHKIPSGPTPFISVSPYLMRVIRHPYRGRGQGQGCQEEGDWKIAVIALSKVRESDVKAVWTLDAGFNARRAWGEWVVHGSIPPTAILTILPLPHLIRLMSSPPSPFPLPISPNPSPNQSNSPFHIPTLISAANLASARNAMSPHISNHTLTHSDGLAIGTLLSVLGIPKRYGNEVTGSILRDWRYVEAGAGMWRQSRGRGRGRWRRELFVDEERWKLNSAFMSGREQGFHYVDETTEWIQMDDDILNAESKRDDDLISISQITISSPQHPVPIDTSNLPANPSLPTQHPPPSHSPTTGPPPFTFQTLLHELETAAFGTLPPNDSLCELAVDGSLKNEDAVIKMEEEMEEQCTGWYGVGIDV